jgi:hypothetical protein
MHVETFTLQECHKARDHVDKMTVDTQWVATIPIKYQFGALRSSSLELDFQESPMSVEA